MSGFVILPLREANLLRRRVWLVQSLRRSFLDEKGPGVVHDLRVASRRLREALDYLKPSLPVARYDRLTGLSQKITKSLGKTREAEVNLKTLEKWRKENQEDPATMEFFLYSQKRRLRKRHAKALKRLSRKSFSKYKAFLGRLKGSRSMPLTTSEILQTRVKEFLDFTWHAPVDDKRLHDLRIRTKKFRYAVEIYNYLNERNLGRFLRRIRNLQEVLGEIHDLSVFAETVRLLKKEAESLDLQIIPGTLQKIYDSTVNKKLELYPRVYPLYSNVIQNAPLQIPLIQAKEVSHAEGPLPLKQVG